MAWWNPFKRGKQEPAPTSPPTPPPTPVPTPPPTPEATPAPAEKKPGLFGRLFGRKKKPEAPPEAPPAAPPAPPAPPGPPAAPPGGEGPSEGAGEGGEGGPKEPAPKEPERTFPSSLGVSADGVWKISETEWDGIMQGVLHGDDVKAFILAIEAGDQKTAAGLVADAYDETVGALIDLERSTIRHIGY